MDSQFDNLKKQVFFGMLDIIGRVFIAVRYSEDVVIGRRGFLDQEKEKGLILVFNKKMKFTFDDYGISATLVFGTSPEKCYIPIGEITAIFSPELNAQFSILPNDNIRQGPAVTDKKKEEKFGSTKNVIKVDFQKKK